MYQVWQGSLTKPPHCRGLDHPVAVGPQCTYHVLLGNNPVASAPGTGLPGPQRRTLCLFPKEHFGPHRHQLGVKSLSPQNLDVCFFSCFVLPFGLVWFPHHPHLSGYLPAGPELAFCTRDPLSSEKGGSSQGSQPSQACGRPSICLLPASPIDISLLG